MSAACVRSVRSHSLFARERAAWPSGTPKRSPAPRLPYSRAACTTNEALLARRDRLRIAEGKKLHHAKRASPVAMGQDETDDLAPSSHAA